MNALLSLVLLFSAPAFATELFSQVNSRSLTGLDFEPNPQKFREEAALYAHFRRFPQSARGTEIWQNCYEGNRPYFFCEMILNPRERIADPGTEKGKRKKFFDALLSLDEEKLRSRTCPSAIKTLKEIAEDTSASSLHLRARYWLWVCAKALGLETEAKQAALFLIERYPVAHHSTLVLQKEFPERLEEILTSTADWPVSFRSVTVPEINPFIAGIEAALELKEDGAAAVLGLHINLKLQEAEPEVRLYMASLMSRVSASIPSVLPVARVLVPLFQKDRSFVAAPLLKLLFPNDYIMPTADPKKRYTFRELIAEYRGQVDHHLLAGLMHQESALNPRAASSAGAYGLTQMLVPTANDQWRKITGNSQATVTPAMLQDAPFAVKLGAADFQRRLGTFSGNTILAVASYNAGETGVKNWLKEVKTIRDPQILSDLLFMSRMQAETHVPQYVSAVLGKAFWYSRLYP